MIWTSMSNHTEAASSLSNSLSFKGKIDIPSDEVEEHHSAACCNNNHHEIKGITNKHRTMITNFSIDSIIGCNSNERQDSRQEYETEREGDDRRTIIDVDGDDEIIDVEVEKPSDIGPEAKTKTKEHIETIIRCNRNSTLNLPCNLEHPQIVKRIRQKNFHCYYCKTSFSNNGQLRNHVRIHTGERPFKCNQPHCQKSFTRNEELTRHKRIHTGLKPYACSRCDQKFGRKDHLQKHQKIHDKIRGSRRRNKSMVGSIDDGSTMVQRTIGANRDNMEELGGRDQDLIGKGLTSVPLTPYNLESQLPYINDRVQLDQSQFSDTIVSEAAKLMSNHMRQQQHNTSLSSRKPTPIVQTQQTTPIQFISPATPFFQTPLFAGASSAGNLLPDPPTVTTTSTSITMGNQPNPMFHIPNECMSRWVNNLLALSTTRTTQSFE